MDRDLFYFISDVVSNLVSVFLITSGKKKNIYLTKSSRNSKGRFINEHCVYKNKEISGQDKEKKKDHRSIKSSI